MSGAQHTPGPWTVDHECISANRAHISMAIGPDGATYAEQKANAARIVACVNACEGIEDPTTAITEFRKCAQDYGKLTAHDELMTALNQKLRADLAEMREGLQGVIDCTDAQGRVFIPSNGSTMRQVRALLARGK